MITPENAHLITHNKGGEPVRIIATDLNHSTYKIAVEFLNTGDIYTCTNTGQCYQRFSSDDDLDLTPIMPPPLLEVGKSYMGGLFRFEIVHHFPKSNTFVGYDTQADSVVIFHPSGVSTGGMFQLDPGNPL